MPERLNTQKFIAIGTVGSVALFGLYHNSDGVQMGDPVTMHRLVPPQKFISTAQPFSDLPPYKHRTRAEHVSRAMQRPPLRSHHSHHHKVTPHTPAHRSSKHIESTHRASPTHHHSSSLNAAAKYWYGSTSELESLGPNQKHNAQIAYNLAMKQWSSTTQVACLDMLWYRESEFQVHDPNPTSDADGIPQALPASKMAKFGEDWQDNPVTQERWGIWYIAGRYATACAAWQHSQNFNWY